MLLPGLIYIALGPWHFGDFRNIFLPNVGEDQYLNCKILHGGTLLQPWLNLSEDQVRSQDFAKGGLFWKFDQTVNELDPNFR